MYSLESVKRGIANYLDEEVIPNVAKGTMEKVLMGTAVGIAIAKADVLVEKLKSNPMVNALQIIDEENKIDIETLEKELLKNIDDAGLELKIPLLDGDFKVRNKEIVFYKEDFQKLFKNIKGEGQ